MINNIFTYPPLNYRVNIDEKNVNSFLDEEIKFWLQDVLASYFHEEIKDISHFRIRPWSQVYKIETNCNGTYIIKIPAEEFAKEAEIILLIESFYSDITTKIITTNKSHGSFLMTAMEGKTLREKLRKHFSQSILSDCALKIGKFQKLAREHLSKFELLDIPKWTSENMIEECKTLLQNQQFLFHTMLSGGDKLAIQSLFPYIQEKLNVLTRIEKGVTVDHGDFQDNNIFISTDHTIFMDWADASITIPSFTIATYIHSILIAHPDIPNKNELIQNILEAYYSGLLDYEYIGLDEKHISLLHILYPIICILKVGRLLNLEERQSDIYASIIMDYWFRIVISFSDAYCDQPL